MRLPKRSYPREALEAAALAVPGVRVRAKGAHWVLAGRRAGELANEALNWLVRQEVVRLHAPLTSAALAAAVKEGLRAVPPDPLEQLEPAVREDRARDAAALLEEARRL